MFSLCFISSFVFFFNDPPTTEIYTLSLHDALPIFDEATGRVLSTIPTGKDPDAMVVEDRKSTRLNSSHSSISYAVFCLKKKKKNTKHQKHITNNFKQLNELLNQHVLYNLTYNTLNR